MNRPYVLVRVGGHRSDARRVMWAKVDPQDYEWAEQYRWIIHESNGTFYAKRSVYTPGDSNTRRRMHRELLGLAEDDAREVDHRNGDGLDNRRSNLRLVTKAQNGQNRHRLRAGKSSRFRGVSWNKDAQKWNAYGHLNHRRHHLGLYESESAAAAVATAWRREHMPYSEADR